MKRIILASSSPRRAELLEKTGLDFDVEPSQYSETAPSNRMPQELARQNALGKARNTAARYLGAIIIGADTIGFLEGRILGKPRTKSEAKEMLRFMSGKCHSVITALSVIESDTGRTINQLVETKVCFKALSDSQIEAYVDSGEPMDKAGAYGIQGLGSELVDRIEGDYFNVVGLPMGALTTILKQFGVDIPREIGDIRS